MDHSEATEFRAAERYVLGDLPVSEAEEFERHFFDCAQCSEELRALAIFQDNARAVFLEPGTESEPALEGELDPQAPPDRPARSAPASGSGAGWWGRLWSTPWVLAPTAALMVVAMLGGYQAGRRRPPQNLAEFPLYAASRGSETLVTPPAGAEFYSVYLDRTWDRDFTSYRAVVREEAGGGEKFSVAVDPPAPGQAIHILIPARVLAAGRHVLTISGVEGPGRETEAARYPFNLKID